MQMMHGDPPDLDTLDRELTSFLKEYDTYADGAVKNAPNDFARQILQAHMSASREAYGKAALAYEAGERVRFRKSEITDGIRLSANLTNGNPAWFEREMGKWGSTIGTDQTMTAADKDALSDFARQQLVNAQVLSWIDRDPVAASAILKDMAKTGNVQGSIDWSEGDQKYNVRVDLGTLEERLKWADYADRKLGEIRQDTAASIRYDIQNAEAMAREGVAPTTPAIPREQFDLAFKDKAVADHEWARYTTARQTATATASLHGRSTAELLAVAQAKPDARDPNFAVTAANQNIRAAAAAGIVQARAADPVAYAIATGDFKFKPLDPQNPQAFSEELKRRAAALPGMAEKYGRGQVLAKTEAQALAASLELMPADRKVEQLESIRGSIGDDAVYASVLNSMRPDSPVTALVGNIAAAGARDNARMIARGEDLLNPSKASKGGDGGKGSAFPMPSETLLRQAWVDSVGDAYRGHPDAEASAYQAFKAYYAAAAADKGLNDPKASPDDRILRAAIQASTGGVMKWKTDWFGNDTPSARIVLPYGMPEDQFRDRVSAEWMRVRDGLGYSKTGVGDIGLYNTGANGEYMVMSGKSWLPDKDGKPVILRIPGAAPAAPAPGQTRVSPREVRGTITEGR